MVPENIIWAFYSPSDYQHLCDNAAVNGKPVPKDTYYKNVKEEWVKTTAVFSCIDDARNNYRLADAKYLGPVFENTKSEVNRGEAWPAKTKEVVEEERKLAIKKRLARVGRVPGTTTIKTKLAFDKYNSLIWTKTPYWDDDFSP
jgi:hypothetical protein